MCKAFNYIKYFCLSYSACIFKELLVRDFGVSVEDTNMRPIELYFNFQIDKFKHYIEKDDNITYNGVIKYIEQFKMFDQLSMLFKCIKLQNYINYIFSHMSKFYCNFKKIDTNNYDFDSICFKIRILEKKNIFTKLPFLFIKNGYFDENLFIDSVIVMEKKSVKFLIHTRPEIYNSQMEIHIKPILFQLKDIIIELNSMKKHIKLKQYIHTTIDIIKKKGAITFWKTNRNQSTEFNKINETSIAPVIVSLDDYFSESELEHHYKID